jgi:hypothetical protein
VSAARRFRRRRWQVAAQQHGHVVPIAIGGDKIDPAIPVHVRGTDSLCAAASAVVERWLQGAVTVAQQHGHGIRRWAGRDHIGSPIAVHIGDHG